MLDWLTRRKSTERRAAEIYGPIVTQARHPLFYTDAAVPDTPEGRLELIVAHIVVVLQRLAAEGTAGQALGRALVETFVADMDDNVREMGIGDTGVARRVRKAAAALYDRHGRYGPALAASDRPALATAVCMAVWGGQPGHAGDADRVAAALLTSSRALAAQDGAALLAGRVTFPPPGVAW